MRQPAPITMLGLVLALLVGGPALAANTNGSGGDMPALYDCQQFTINFKELPPNAEKAVFAHNKSINIIYMSDQAMEEGFNFISVLDAIQGEGFNPLWQEVQVVFAKGVTPFQLCSDDAINDAHDMGLIDLVPTDEV